MDGLSTNNLTFDIVCQCIGQYTDAQSISQLAQDERVHYNFKLDCAEAFRSAVQLLEEGHISEEEYYYIVGLAFWIESMTCDYKNTYFKQFISKERKEEKNYENDN